MRGTVRGTGDGACKFAFRLVLISEGNGVEKLGIDDEKLNLIDF
jgi:hypothetical protein